MFCFFFYRKNLFRYSLPRVTSLKKNIYIYYYCYSFVALQSFFSVTLIISTIRDDKRNSFFSSVGVYCLRRRRIFVPLVFFPSIYIYSHIGVKKKTPHRGKTCLYLLYKYIFNNRIVTRDEWCADLWDFYTRINVIFSKNHMARRRGYFIYERDWDPSVRYSCFLLL